MTEKYYCCYDCKHLKIPFEIDDTEMPIPTNPYCKLGNDKDFPRVQSRYCDCINHAEYEKHICNQFKLKLSVKLHIRKPYNLDRMI